MLLKQKKKCNLINSNGTLKNIHNRKETKRLNGGKCRTVDTVCVARCKIPGDIYVGNTGQELRERFKEHR